MRNHGIKFWSLLVLVAAVSDFARRQRRQWRTA